jgi:hypothetical protein
MAQTDAFLDELVRVSADLDRLIADRQVGRPSQPRHDGHVDQAEKLAMRLRGAGRGPGRPIHAPIGKTPCGKTIW